MKHGNIKKGKAVKINTPFIISLSLIAILVAGYFFIPPYKNGIDDAYRVLTSKNEKLVREWVEQFGIGGPIVLILLMVLQMFLFVVPNILVMMISIVSYGPIWGSVISFLGVFASSSVGYAIGRKLGPYTLNRLVSQKILVKLVSFLENYGVGAIAITRLASLSNDSLSIAAGLLRMSYRKYILATLTGIAPLIVLLAIYGKNGKIEKALVWIAAISMVLLIVYIIIDKRRKKKNHLVHKRKDSTH